jgi:hypothetical protein
VRALACAAWPRDLAGPTHWEARQRRSLTYSTASSDPGRGELLLEHAYTCKLLALDDVVDLEQVWLARLDPDIGEYRHQLLAKGLPLLS